MLFDGEEKITMFEKNWNGKHVCATDTPSVSVTIQVNQLLSMYDKSLNNNQ